MTAEKSIGLIVRQLRGDLSLREFAVKCGVSHTTIDNLEKGIDFRTGKPTQVKYATLRRIADACNVPLSSLLIDKIISRLEENNRIEIVRQFKNYSLQEICDIIGVQKNEYEKFIAQNFSTNDTTLANLSQRSGLPIEFLNGLEYTTQNPLDQWPDDYQQDYFLASDSIKMIIECKIGAPAFKPKNKPAAPISLSELKLAILDVIDQIPEEQQRAFLEMAKIYRDSLKKD